MYTRALNFFNSFRKDIGLANVWPVSLHDIVAFIAYMYKSGFAHSTINSYTSGLSFYNKLNDYEDYTQKFIVRKMIDGVKRTRSPQMDTRLPISRELLGRILSILSCICSSAYEVRLFKAVFSLAFHGLFRVGELTVQTMSNTCYSNHALNVNDVQIYKTYLEIHLVSSKTDQFGRGVTIHIPEQLDKCICPVVLLPCYLRDRPVVEGPLFCHFDGKPLTKYQFSAILKKSLHALGIDNARWSSHSFRIGMATACAIEGLSDEKIKSLGRWKSGAYLRYIRTPV